MKDNSHASGASKRSITTFARSVSTEVLESFRCLWRWRELQIQTPRQLLVLGRPLLFSLSKRSFMGRKILPRLYSPQEVFELRRVEVNKYGVMCVLGSFNVKEREVYIGQKCQVVTQQVCFDGSS